MQYHIVTQSLKHKGMPIEQALNPSTDLTLNRIYRRQPFILLYT
jgi:hypothetical protein